MEVISSFDISESNTVTDESYVFLWQNTAQQCHWWKLCIPLIEHSPTLSLVEVMRCSIKHSPTLSLMKVICSFDRTQSNTVTDGSYVSHQQQKTVQYIHWWEYALKRQPNIVSPNSSFERLWQVKIDNVVAFLTQSQLQTYHQIKARHYSAKYIVLIQYHINFLLAY